MKAKHEPDDRSIVQKSIPASELKRSTMSIRVDQIDVPPKRARKVVVSDEHVVKFAENVRQSGGLLAPIAVRVTNDRYELIFGASRLAAGRLNGDDSISAIVFGPELTDDQARLLEISENYFRAELTAEELIIHRLEYAGLLKKMGAVIPRREKQGKSKSAAAAKAEGEGIVVNPVDNNKSDEERETVTERLCKAFGLSRQALAKATKKAIEIAQEQGVKIASDATLETMDAETLDKVADAMAKQAQIEKTEPKPKPEAPLKADKKPSQELIDKIATEVASALGRIWKDYPEVDWRSFAAIVRGVLARLTKTGNLLAKNILKAL
jgi:ParB-like chromosome segregation protein Spo0J